MFDELKQEIAPLIEALEDNWVQKNLDSVVFEELAVQTLKSVQILTPTEIDTLIREIDSLDADIQKHIFSSSPVTLYETKNLIVEIEIWKNNDPRVHAHQYLGAFKILKGSAQQAKYEFETQDTFTNTLSLGSLLKTEEKHLPPNHIEMISNESDFIHSVLYFETPTVTLLIRNKSKGTPSLYCPGGFKLSINRHTHELVDLLKDLEEKTKSKELKENVYHEEDLMILAYLMTINSRFNEESRNFLYKEISQYSWANSFLTALSQNTFFQKHF